MTRIEWAPSQSKRFDPPRFRNLRLANEQRNPWRVNLRNLATFSTAPAGYSLPRTRFRGYPRFEWIRDRASVVPEKKRTAGKRVFLPSLPSKLKGKRREREREWTNSWNRVRDYSLRGNLANPSVQGWSLLRVKELKRIFLYLLLWNSNWISRFAWNCFSIRIDILIIV